MAKLNTNGTFDFGPMQINSIWLKTIKPYGYTQQQLQFDPCANVMVGVWILAQNISTDHNYWNAIGDYHSKTIIFNRLYQDRIKSRYEWLSQYF